MTGLDEDRARLFLARFARLAMTRVADGPTPKAPIDSVADFPSENSR